MSQNITLLGASYSDVPSVLLPKTGGGTASFTDVTDTTAAASDVASGKYFYTAAGVRTAGTSSGGGNDFVVTLSYNDQTEMWEPDCTYAQAYAAYSGGKDVVAVAGDYNGANIVYDDESEAFYYIVNAVFDDFDGSQYYNYGIENSAYCWTASGIEIDEASKNYNTELATATPSDVAQGQYFFNASGIQVGTASGGSSVKTATGTFTGNGTRTIDVSCSWEPDLVYFTSNPGTTASSGTVAAIIVRGMMTATRYRNNSTTNSHYAIPGIANMNSSGSSYSWRATYANSKVTLYCYSSNARSLLTNGRTYSYTFMKWT